MEDTALLESNRSAIQSLGREAASGIPAAARARTVAPRKLKAKNSFQSKRKASGFRHHFHKAFASPHGFLAFDDNQMGIMGDAVCDGLRDCRGADFRVPILHLEL